MASVTGTSAIGTWSRFLVVIGLLAAVVVTGPLAEACFAGARPSTLPSDEYGPDAPLCERAPWFCTDTITPDRLSGEYVGHDEPSLLFYSDVPGSGNSNFYTVTLPKDPPTLPRQDGTGGTFNFQLHPAFWFGMVICDNQSAPEFTHAPCTPSSDANIFDGSDPSAADYIGKHPGTAFMEMQFYPPGWTGPVTCDGTHWCAALNIDSLNFDQNNHIQNNKDCLDRIGEETVNFAFITKSGKSDTPASPLNPNPINFRPDTDIVFNSGDSLQVRINDTPDGLQVAVTDVTSGQKGSMTASIANGFEQVVFDPSAAKCAGRPYAFHPMYSTSSEHTRVPWAAHSFNVAFSDEIGHFEYCNAIDKQGGICTVPGVDDPVLDDDDQSCFDTNGNPPFVPLIGCIASDDDFDGSSYQLVWPGTNPNLNQDEDLHPAPIRFTSPTFQGTNGEVDYSRVAFETDLPVIEADQKCDTDTGANCSNPPRGADFYPFYSAQAANDRCEWQLGGASIAGSTNSFGGSSTAEYGSLLRLAYPAKGGPIFNFNDYRQTLSVNPCQTTGSQPAGKISAPAAITEKRNPGQNIKAGSFRYKNTSDSVQQIGTVALTVSNPAMLASLRVSAAGQNATASPVAESNALSFNPPVSVGAGDTVSFAVTAQLAGKNQAARGGMVYASLIDLSGSDRGEHRPLCVGLLLVGFALIPFGNRRRRVVLVMLGALALMTTFVACGGGSGSSSAPGTSATVTSNGDLSRVIPLSTASVKGGGSSKTTQQLTGLGFQ